MGSAALRFSLADRFALQVACFSILDPSSLPRIVRLSQWRLCCFADLTQGFATPFMTYFSKWVTTKPFLKDVTEVGRSRTPSDRLVADCRSQVPLYGVLLFGAKVNIDLQRGLTVGQDGWVMMRAWPRIGVLVNSLRRLFDADLEANLEEPSFQGPSLLSLRLVEC